jgi:TolA-binding protein
MERVGRLRSLFPARLGLPGRGGLGLLGGLALVGCVTSGEGAAMRSDIAKLREQIEAMERRDVEANEQVARLRKILDEATALLTRNSADVGARVNKHEGDIAALTGRLEEAQHILDQLQKQATANDGRLAALEQTQAKIVDRVAPAMPEDKEGLWREAQSRMQQGSREDARRFYRAFLQRFPQDPRAAEAQLQIGRSFQVEGKHTQAAGEFQKVIEAHPKAPEVPEAMFLLGASFVDLKFCSDARELFADLAKRFPRSPRAAEARARVKDLQRIAKDKRLCTS